jgi:hypothetical protein
VALAEPTPIGDVINIPYLIAENLDSTALAVAQAVPEGVAEGLADAATEAPRDAAIKGATTYGASMVWETGKTAIIGGVTGAIAGLTTAVATF